VNYSGCVVIVTGASSGIGKQIALDFAKRGATLMLVARRESLLQQTAEECAQLGAQACILPGDLSSRAFAESVVGATLARFHRIDILINNAGIAKHKQIYDVTPEDIDDTMRVNFMAPAYLTLAALPPMLRQHEGYIVNISSGAGRMASARGTVYAASKFALTGFSEGLAIDLAGSNIHCAVIHAGPIETDIWDKAAVEAPIQYSGRRYPPSLVSAAVFECIEKRRHEATVPRRLWAVPFYWVADNGLFRLPWVINRVPELRQFFFGRYFFDRAQAALVLALVATPLVWSFSRGALLWAPYVVLRASDSTHTLSGPRRLLRPLFYLPRDLASFALLVGGSIRYRTILL
jgi:short-subunit dehydrogenase